MEKPGPVFDIADKFTGLVQELEFIQYRGCFQHSNVGIRYFRHFPVGGQDVIKVFPGRLEAVADDSGAVKEELQLTIAGADFFVGIENR